MCNLVRKNPSELLCNQIDSNTNRNCHNVQGEVVSTSLKGTFSKNNEKTRKTKEWLFSEPFTMEALDWEITKQKTENITVKDIKKKNSDHSMYFQSNLAKIGSRLAQARSCYKRQKILRILNCVLQGVFFSSLCLLT